MSNIDDIKIIKDVSYIEDSSFVLYWMPRSGGTLIYQIFLNIFGYIFKTTHDFIETDIPIVAVYRDFRDVGFSHWRIMKAYYDSYDRIVNKINKEDVWDMVDSAKKRIKTLDQYKQYYGDYKDILWLKYEDFYNNYNYLFTRIKEFFRLYIPDFKRKSIIADTNIKKNKERASNIKIIDPLEFANWDQVSKIHARHIYTGIPGEWRNIIPKRYHYVMNDLLKEELNRYGYNL